MSESNSNPQQLNSAQQEQHVDWQEDQFGSVQRQEQENNEAPAGAKDPFPEMLSNLTRSAGEAQKNWKDSQNEEPQKRTSIWKDWTLLAIDMISQKMDDSQIKIQALHLLTKNLTNANDGGLIEPQESEERKHNGDIQKTHIIIVKQLTELLSVYVQQKVEFDNSIAQAANQLKQSEATIKQVQEQMLVMQDLLKKSGLNSDAISKAMPQLEQQNADKASQEGLEKQREIFNRKQDIIGQNLCNSLRILKNEEPLELLNDPNENLGGQMVHRPGVAAYTRDLLVFQSDRHDVPGTSFRWMTLDHKIVAFKLHYDSAWGINSFQAKLANGDVSQLLGKSRNGSVQELSLPKDAVVCVRVRPAGGPVTPRGLEFKSETEIKAANVYNGGNWDEFKLEPNECIVGVYGESYDHENEWNSLKKLGFIVAKQAE